MTEFDWQKAYGKDLEKGSYESNGDHRDGPHHGGFPGLSGGDPPHLGGGLPGLPGPYAGGEPPEHGDMHHIGHI